MILEQEIEKIRAVRQRISAECGHDPKRLVEYYRNVSRQLQDSGRFRFVGRIETAPKPAAPTKS